jgi:hypothetical protein
VEWIFVTFIVTLLDTPDFVMFFVTLFVTLFPHAVRYA